MDVYNIKGVYNKKIVLLLFTNRYFNLIWDYYLLNETAESLMECIKYLLKWIDR